jgi:hypothetical protein
VSNFSFELIPVEQEETVHQHNGKWYFYDENHERHGPYLNKKHAEYKLKKYVDHFYED